MVTLAEVARQAGVSPSTVSYVLSRKRSISEDTRRKVEAAIEALGYHPHAGARGACVDHLADLGHRDIALIGESEAVYQRQTGFAARTLAGFQRRIAERGLRAVHRTCEGTYESTAGVLARILEERPTTTGFVVQNEAAIAPLLSLLRLSRRVVPEDTSVVAICPDQVALQSLPRLTSVSIPAEEMGRRAVRQALAQVEGDRSPSVTLVPSQLVVRDSSTAAPAIP